MADRSSSAPGEEASSNAPTRTTTPQEDSSSLQRSFVFVDSMAESGRSREAIRVHVMRESHRSRRVALGQPTSSASRGELQIWDTGSSSSESASQASQSRRGSRQDPTVMATPRRRALPISSIDFPSTESTTSIESPGRQADERSRSQLSQCMVAPMTVLGGGRRDPVA